MSVGGGHKSTEGSVGDGASVSSLQEFESMEAHIQQFGSGTLSRGSVGSQDSLEAGNGSASTNGGGANGGPSSSSAALRNHLKMRMGYSSQRTQSGDGDCLSVDSSSSLQEFENMEEACQEAEAVESRAKEQEEVLSEIEEGHESQLSESCSDTCETISEGGAQEGEVDDVEDPEEFEARLFQIDEIIKQAQTNVEQFDQSVVMSLSSQSVPLEEILGSKQGSLGQIPTGGVLSSGGESEDSLELLPSSGVQGESVLQPPTPQKQQQHQDSSSGLMQASIDSLEMKQAVIADESAVKLMQLSTDSIEMGKILTTAGMTDSLDMGKTTDKMIISTDSIEGGASAKAVGIMDRSVDSLEGKTAATAGLMEKSTDSLESADQILGRAKKMLLIEKPSRIPVPASRSHRSQSRDLDPMTDSVEKMDSSCEESYLEVGPDGRSTGSRVVVKHVIDPETSVTSVVAERRTQQGLTDITSDMFKQEPFA